MPRRANCEVGLGILSWSFKPVPRSSQRVIGRTEIEVGVVKDYEHQHFVDTEHNIYSNGKEVFATVAKEGTLPMSKSEDELFQRSYYSHVDIMS